MTMMEDLKRTCLYDSHVALGAQMSPFGGFMMPIQYTSITEEHNAVRHSSGMFDVSHMGEILIEGPDAERFTGYIFTNDVRDMEDGKILYGMMLYPDGGTVDDLLVYRMASDRFLLVVNASNIGKDYDWICSNIEGHDVSVKNISEEWAEIALQGPDAETVMSEVLGLDLGDLIFYTFRTFIYNKSDMIVSRTGYTGEDGFEIYASPEAIADIWGKFLAAGVVPCGLGCRDTLRFEVGLPLYGHELSEKISPVMAGLGMFVKTDKGEFVGRDAIVKQKSEGVSRKVIGIELADKAVPRAGYPVEADGDVIGEVTTGYQSISTGKSVCMALVDREHTALGTGVEVRIRKRTFPGTVCKKRFYNTSYKK